MTCQDSLTAGVDADWLQVWYCFGYLRRYGSPAATIYGMNRPWKKDAEMAFDDQDRIAPGNRLIAFPGDHLTIKLFPVISAGFSIPRRSSTVGATSASRPSFLSLTILPIKMNGTGWVV